MTDNPYIGTDKAESWEKGYQYGREHPDKSDPRPPLFLSADGKPAWQEGALAGREGTQIPSPQAPMADPAIISASSDEPSSEDIRQAVANASIQTADVDAG